jgi:hypothetical protein
MGMMVEAPPVVSEREQLAAARATLMQRAANSDYEWDLLERTNVTRPPRDAAHELILCVEVRRRLEIKLAGLAGETGDAVVEGVLTSVGQRVAVQLELQSPGYEDFEGAVFRALHARLGNSRESRDRFMELRRAFHPMTAITMFAMGECYPSRRHDCSLSSRDEAELAEEDALHRIPLCNLPAVGARIRDDWLRRPATRVVFGLLGRDRDLELLLEEPVQVGQSWGRGFRQRHPCVQVTSHILDMDAWDWHGRVLRPLLRAYGLERLLVFDQIPCFVGVFGETTCLTSTAVLSIRGVVDCQVSVPDDLRRNRWVRGHEQITVTRSGAATADVVKSVFDRSEGERLWIMDGAHVNAGAETMRALADRQSIAFVTEPDAGGVANPWGELGHMLRNVAQADPPPQTIREAALRLVRVTMAFGRRENAIVSGAFARCGLLPGHEDDPLRAGLIGDGAPHRSRAQIMNCAEIIANLTRGFGRPRRGIFREDGEWGAEPHDRRERERLAEAGTLRVVEEVEAGHYPRRMG